jgi:hypothetical protein
MEARVHALLANVNDTPLKFRFCDVLKEIPFLKLEKVCDFYFHIRLSRRRTVYLINLLNHCPRLGHFPAFLKEAMIITLTKPDKDPKCTSDHPLVHYGQII